MGSLVSATPPYGQRLIPVEIDRQAKETPDRLLFSVPISNKFEDGFTHITVAAYANAINRASWWIESTLGKSKTFDAVGYLGPADLRYPILAIALCKTGHKILLISPRNSIEGDLNVIDKSNCSTWLLPSQHHRYPNLSKIFAARKNMTVIPVPEASEFLNPTPVDPYPFSKTFKEAEKEPLLALHSSGSTGLPKPIDARHGMMATLDAQNLILESENGSKLQSKCWTKNKWCSAFPLFHAAGIYLVVSNIIYLEAHVVLTGDIPITPALINHIIVHEKVRGLKIAPSIVAEIVNDPLTYENLDKLEFILSGGGPISPAVGKKVNAKTRLDNVMGSTEGSSPPAFRILDDDWEYCNFHECNGFEYRDVGQGLYEQWQVRNPKYELFQGYLKTYFDLDEFCTQDLYAKHPTKPGFWIYRGRADDVIVLSNGEKVNPLDIEKKINEHSAVRSALVIGQAQFQTALLIQLKDTTPLSEGEKDELLKSLESYIAEANEVAPEHARIQEGFVMFSDPSKPFLRAGKGTVQRAATVRLYQPEIDEFYAKMDAMDYLGEFDITSLDGLKGDLRKMCSALNKTKKSIGDGDDIFASGFDSLAVITLIRRLKSILRAHKVDESRLQPSLVYENPTVSSLAGILYEMIRNPETQTPGATNVQLMHELFLKYSANLPTATRRPLQPPESELSVILTGSTGSLGSYILESLIANPSVKTIYCLNRSADARTRQQIVSKINGFNTDFSSISKVKFLHTDLAKSKLGLSDTEYSNLQEHATHIIHNAWPVNFNLSLSSFIPQIQGVRNLIDFSSASKFNPEIFFVSSIGVVQGKKWDGPVKEEVIADYEAASMGYGASKLVSEMILNEAVKVGAVKGTICRVGQIAGPVEKKEGCWNKWEWFPSIIISSKYLKCLPNNLGTLSRIDWIPVDILSKIILELSLSSLHSTKSAKIFHTINPTATTWSSLIPTVREHLGSDAKMVSFAEWVDLLKISAEKHVASEEDINPAVKLVGFFEEMVKGEERGDDCVVLETNKTRDVSQGMRQLSGVRKEWMGLWLGQWGF